MEFMLGDSFGGYAVYKGKTPARFKTKFHTAMTDIQVHIQHIPAGGNVS